MIVILKPALLDVLSEFNEVTIECRGVFTNLCAISCAAVCVVI